MFLAYCEASRSITTDFLAKASGIMLFILPPGFFLQLLQKSTFLLACGGTIDNTAGREFSHKYSARPNTSYSSIERSIIGWNLEFHRHPRPRQETLKMRPTNRLGKPARYRPPRCLKKRKEKQKKGTEKKGHSKTVIGIRAVQKDIS